MNYKLVLESAPGQQCTHTEHQPQDEEVKERPCPSTVLYLSVLHPWGWTVLGLGSHQSEPGGKPIHSGTPGRHNAVRQSTNWGRDTSAWDFSRKQESVRYPLLMCRWGRMRWHLLILGSHQLIVPVLDSWWWRRPDSLDRSETLSSHSRCLETFTCTTENLVQDHHHLDGKLLHKWLLGLGGTFSRADCHNQPPPLQLAGHIPQMLQGAGGEFLDSIWLLPRSYSLLRLESWVYICISLYCVLCDVVTAFIHSWLQVYYSLHNCAYDV